MLSGQGLFFLFKILYGSLPVEKQECPQLINSFEPVQQLKLKFMRQILKLP